MLPTTQVDEEYGVRGKAAQAAQNINDAAESIQSKYNLRQRLRNFMADVRRTAPGVSTAARAPRLVPPASANGQPAGTRPVPASS